MRYLIDIIGCAGYSSILAGIYLKYGLEVCLMVGGVMALVFALFAARGLKRA